MNRIQTGFVPCRFYWCCGGRRPQETGYLVTYPSYLGMVWCFGNWFGALIYTCRGIIMDLPHHLGRQTDVSPTQRGLRLP